MSCKRNAFMMLIHADQERALNYLSSCIDQVPSFGDILQLVIVELIYKVTTLPLLASRQGSSLPCTPLAPPLFAPPLFVPTAHAAHAAATTAP